MKRVLVVDDEPSLRKLYERELKKEGYEVLLAEDGVDAVQKAREGRPDLVVLDLRMPKLDGLGTMSRILEENNVLPVVINTAFSSYKDSFMSWSADAYLTKSADLTELKEVIGVLIEKRVESCKGRISP